ncbi:hypothetical protein Plhal710r2_c041g0141521 [Plasmopara halstedii]
MVPEPQRSFRLHVSRVFGLGSLADFMRGASAWPMQQDFVERHIDYTLARLTPGLQAKWLRRLYKEATQIVTRLGASQLVLSPSNSERMRLLPHLGCTSGVKTSLLPNIPRSALLRAVWTPKLPMKPHPMMIHSQRVNEVQITSFVNFGKHLRAILQSVFEDLQFRLAFRLLPVRSRFWFLEASHPGIRKCVSDGCNAIETEQHLFSDCTLASHLWRQVLPLVFPLFITRPTWLDIALTKKMRVFDGWQTCEDVVGDVWHVLRVVTLHFIWSDRNRCLFDGRQSTQTLAAIKVIFTTFFAHLQYFQRRLLTEDTMKGFHMVLRRLKTFPVFGDFVERFPGIKNVREPM